MFRGDGISKICNPGAIGPNSSSGSELGKDTVVATVLGVVSVSGVLGPEIFSETPEINIPIKIPHTKLIVVFLTFIIFFLFIDCFL